MSSTDRHIGLRANCAFKPLLAMKYSKFAGRRGEAAQIALGTHVKMAIYIWVHDT